MDDFDFYYNQLYDLNKNITNETKNKIMDHHHHHFIFDRQFGWLVCNKCGFTTGESKYAPDELITSKRVRNHRRNHLQMILNILQQRFTPNIPESTLEQIKLHCKNSKLKKLQPTTSKTH
jgi:hypothetical protein